MKHNIYTVHVTEDAERRTVVVLVAETAQDAGERAIRNVPGATDADAEVGMLGVYDPGITGAHLSQGEVIAIQRIGHRS